LSEDKQRLIFHPDVPRFNGKKSSLHRNVGVLVDRLGVVDGGVYVYFPHIPVKTLERPRPVRLAVERIELAEWDLINDGSEVPQIEIPTYLRPSVPKRNRRLFQQTFRAPVTVLGAKGQEIHTVASYHFIQEHTRDEDPAPTGYFTDEQRHAHNLMKAENGDRMQGLIRGSQDRKIVRLENNEALQMLNLAVAFHQGDDLDKLAELRLRFVLMEQSAASFRKWTGLSERYLAHLDRYISKWWKGSLYPRSENGVLTRIPGKKPKNADRIIRRGLKSGIIPAESVN
jgi:hypothetical protein